MMLRPELSSEEKPARIGNLKFQLLNFKRTASQARARIRGKVGVRILIHQADQIVAAEIQSQSGDFGGSKAEPNQSPWKGNEDRGLVQCAREFQKQFLNRPGA